MWLCTQLNALPSVLCCPPPSHHLQRFNYFFPAGLSKTNPPHLPSPLSASTAAAATAGVCPRRPHTDFGLVFIDTSFSNISLPPLSLSSWQNTAVRHATRLYAKTFVPGVSCPHEEQQPWGLFLVDIFLRHFTDGGEVWSLVHCATLTLCKIHLSAVWLF